MRPDLTLEWLVLLLLLDLQEQSAVDVGKDTSEGDGCADEGVEFFVSADGELEMAGCDTFDLQVLCGVLLGFVSNTPRHMEKRMTHSCKLEDFSSQVFEDSRHVNCRLGAYSHLVLCVVLQETLDTTARELKWHVSMCADARMRRKGEISANSKRRWLGRDVFEDICRSSIVDSRRVAQFETGDGEFADSIASQRGRECCASYREVEIVPTEGNWYC
jgi:hypothetical protein